MKKLSLIVALAVVLTVGGVFATWAYNDGAATGGNDTSSITINAATTTTPKGEISVSVGDLKIKNDGSYKTVWDETVDDTVTITFTPGTYASDDTKANGIEYTVTITESFGEATIGSTTVDIVTIGEGTFNLAKGKSATFRLRDKVNLTAATLDTSAKHGQYTTALSGKSITITVAEKTA